MTRGSNEARALSAPLVLRPKCIKRAFEEVSSSQGLYEGLVVATEARHLCQMSDATTERISNFNACSRKKCLSGLGYIANLKVLSAHLVT